VQIDQYDSIPDAFFDRAQKSPEATVYRQAAGRESGSQLHSRTYKEVAARILRAAEYLRAHGVGKGTAVAVLSNTRPEWLEADLAILSCGAMTASIYQSLPAADAGYILYDSGARIVFAENQEQVDKLIALSATEIPIAGHEDRAACSARIDIQKIISFEETVQHPLVIEWRTIVESHEPPPQRPPVRIDRFDLAALVYTSGTTGPPKGVMQTHANHLANVRQVFDCRLVSSESTITLFLPLAHSFARLMGYIGFLTQVEIAFPAVADRRSSRVDPKDILRDISRLSSTIVPVVPRFLEKMKEGVEAQSRKPGPKGLLLRTAIRAAQQHFTDWAAGEKSGLLTQLAYRGTAALRKKIRLKLFGPNFRFCVSGGAKLPLHVAEFFAALDVTILEGYGLTETCVATNVNPITRNKLGTVGPVLSEDIEMRIADDGEIMYRGPNITNGYFRRPTATAACWIDGWFHTGDLGAVDEERYLSIIGRKKELIVTSGGKKIPPQAIEDQLKTIPFVSQAVLLGDGKPFCVALLSLDQQQVRDWAQKHDLPQTTAWHSYQPLFEQIWPGIEAINQTLSSYETVKNVYIVPGEFTVENGMLTPTFKTKRGAIEERFKNEIEELYRQTRKLS